MTKVQYPRKFAIRRAIEAARDLGLEVSGFEITPDGGIKIIDRSAILHEPKDEFEKWEAAGKLG